MENRKQAILRAVVHEFTTSAVPVGSQALQSRYFVNLPSSTTRCAPLPQMLRGWSSGWR